MNKAIRNLAIVAVFCFIGLPGFPKEVQQEETPTAMISHNVVVNVRGRPVEGLRGLV